jgi:hypothetical protein
LRAAARGLLVAGVLAGCGAALPEPDASDVEKLGVIDSGVTLEHLEHGRSLYVARCAGCHTLKDPRSLTSEAWIRALRTMQVEEGVRLQASEARDIERFLVAMSSDGPRTTR